jgi:hypothetical protein
VVRVAAGSKSVRLGHLHGCGEPVTGRISAVR